MKTQECFDFTDGFRLQNSRSGSSARSAEISRASREPHTPEGRVRREKPAVAFPYNEFVLSRGLETVWIMPPRCQTMSVSCLIFIDNSTHMLNLILSMVFAQKIILTDHKRIAVRSCLLLCFEACSRLLSTGIFIVLVFNRLENVDIFLLDRMDQTTPKKLASKRGRKPKQASALDNCRLCGCCFNRAPNEK